MIIYKLGCVKIELIKKLVKNKPKILIIAVIVLIIAIITSKIIITTTVVIDGNTIELNGDKIKLYGIDAPESEQLCKASDMEIKIPCGKIAKRKLIEMINGNKIRCEIKRIDSHERKLGFCYVRNINLNEEMVRKGYAKSSIKYYNTFLIDELYAKRYKLGFWSGEFKSSGN